MMQSAKYFRNEAHSFGKKVIRFVEDEARWYGKSSAPINDGVGGIFGVCARRREESAVPRMVVTEM